MRKCDDKPRIAVQKAPSEDIGSEKRVKSVKKRFRWRRAFFTNIILRKQGRVAIGFDNKLRDTLIRIMTKSVKKFLDSQPIG